MGYFFLNNDSGKLSEKEGLLITYAIRLGYVLEGLGGICEGIKKSKCSVALVGLKSKMRIFPKRSTRPITLEEALKADPFMRGLDDAFSEKGIQDPLSRDNPLAEARSVQYTQGFMHGQAYLDEFKKELQQLNQVIIQQNLKEGFQGAKYN